MSRPTVEFDDSTGVMTINGVRLSYGACAALGFGPIGSYLRIDERRDGTVTLTMFSPELRREFDRIAGIPATKS